MNIRRGILIKFYPATYTADVLLMEATSTQLQGVPVNTNVDGTSAQTGAYCAVLLFDEHNLSDGCILAIYPNGSSGVPTPAPGRIVFVAGYNQVNSLALASGVLQAQSIAGIGGIAVGALGIVFKAFFVSATVGAYVQIAPHGGAIDAYASFGNTPVANATINANGIVPLDASGSIDIKANAGGGTITLYTYGYIM